MSTSMNAIEFLAFVEREADLAPPNPVRAVQATLATLGERISGGESDDVAAELPESLRHLVRNEGNAAPLDLDGPRLATEVLHAIAPQVVSPSH
jgi:uncharacterized protein (DUF2267 family)